MRSRSLPILKEHEMKIKNCLDVYPNVLYGEEANEKMKQYFKDYKKKSYNGYFNPLTNEVYILILNKFSIGTLAHELRHAYQFNIKGEYFNFPDDWFKKDPFYKCRYAELDANRYARDYCEENDLGRRLKKRYSKKVTRIERKRELHKLTAKHSCP